MCESQKSLDSIQNAKKHLMLAFFIYQMMHCQQHLQRLDQETHTRHVLVFLETILKYLADFFFMLKMGENYLFSLLTNTGLH